MNEAQLKYELRIQGATATVAMELEKERCLCQKERRLREATERECEAIEREREAIERECEAIERECEAIERERDAIERELAKRERELAKREREAAKREREAVEKSMIDVLKKYVALAVYSKFGCDAKLPEGWTDDRSYDETDALADKIAGRKTFDEVLALL